MRYLHALLGAALGLSLALPGSAGAAPGVVNGGAGPRIAGDGRPVHRQPFRSGMSRGPAVFSGPFESPGPGVVVVPMPVTVPVTVPAPPPPAAEAAPPPPPVPETIRPTVPHPGSKVIEVSPLPPGTKTVPVIVQRGSSTVVERVPVR